MKEYGPYAHRDPGVPTVDQAGRPIPPLGVIFWQEAVEDASESAKQGVPIYDDVTYAKLLVPGAMQSYPIYEVMRTKASGQEKVDRQVMARFKQAFELYRDKQSPAAGGTPLEEWPQMSSTLVRGFKDVNVFTVQQLAAMHDSVIDKVRGVPNIHGWRAKAQAWLEDGRGSAEVADLRAQIAELTRRLNDQGRGMSEQIAQQNGVTDGFEKRRGGRRGRSDGEDIPVELPSEGDLDLEAARL